MRIGIFGGAFDPPHIGHLTMAQRAMNAAELSCVIFVPSGKAPHKLTETHPLDRANMVKLAIEGRNRFYMDVREAVEPGVTYTVDTLRQFEAKGNKLFLILGSDQYRVLNTWKDHKELEKLATLVVGVRHGLTTNIHAPFIFSQKDLPLSSSEIRNRIQRCKQVEDVKYLVPDSVIAYIRENGLYGTTKSS